MSGYPDIPEGFEGVVTPEQFIWRWNEIVNKDLPIGHARTTVEMHSDLSDTFWRVAYANGYEWGAKDTVKAVTSKHTEMSAELQVLRDNQTDKADTMSRLQKAEDELRKAAEGLKAQRDQIIDMERERRAIVNEMELLSLQNARLIGRSPINAATVAVERVAQRVRHRWLNGR